MFESLRPQDLYLVRFGAISARLSWSCREFLLSEQFLKEHVDRARKRKVDRIHQSIWRGA